MGRPPLITRERVVEVAIRLLDVEGVQGLSVDRIAGELGVRGPSLYYYYADKAAILDAVATSILSAFILDRRADNWIDWMVENALELYRRVMAHPNVAHLLLEHMPPRAAAAGFGQGARMMTEAGVDRSLQLELLQGAQHVTWGFILHRALIATNDLHRVEPDWARYPELEAAQRANRSSDEELLERATRALIAGLLSAGTSGTTSRRRKRSVGKRPTT